MLSQMMSTIQGNGVTPAISGQNRQAVLNNFQAVYDWQKPILTAARQGSTYCTTDFQTGSFEGSMLGWTASVLFTSVSATPTTSTSEAYGYSTWSATGNNQYYAGLQNV